MKKRLEAIELWSYRRMLGMLWTGHVSNDELLSKMGTKIVFVLRMRKMQLKGYFEESGLRECDTHRTH